MRVYIYLLKTICFFGFANLFLPVKPLPKLGDDVGRHERTNLLEAVILVFGVLEEVGGGHPFGSGERHLNGEEAI